MRSNFGLVATGHETDHEAQALRNLIVESRRFCTEFLAGAEPRWLILTGGSGVGKTHVGRWIADLMSKNAARVYGAHYRDNDLEASLFSHVQPSGYFCKWETLMDLARDGDYGPLKRTAVCWAKVIDDIGAYGFEERSGVLKPTAFTINQLGKLSDRRLGKWTVFTTNFSRSQIGEIFDQRIASRWMRGGNVTVDLAGVRDYGLRKAVK